MKRACLMADGKLITATDMELAPGPARDVDLDLRTARGRVEQDLIQQALTRSNGIMSTAAKLLGISRPTLYAMMESHGMAPGPAKFDAAPNATEGA
jgi:two-component system NtrC family response regulator